MKRLNSSTAFLIALLLIIGGLAIGSFSFFSGMNSQYILIHRGSSPVKHIVNHYSYSQNRKAFIFSLSFLTTGVCFFIMVALPSEETSVIRKTAPAPERQRADREDSGISAVMDQKQPQEIIETEQIGSPQPKLETEEIQEAPMDKIDQDDTLETDMFEEVKEGEDDVVYGEGPISDAAIIHFVHKFPDSALKFLYRKQLDGKALTSTEEDIYQSWEKRHMTRGKVKSYIQTLMDWQEFPKKPLYEIWKDIRDHIFENVELG